MTAAVATLNIVLGLVYMQYGTMTLVEMKRNWKSMGFSHFGAAWIAMAFTCGPHHLFHGIHVAFEGRNGGVLDLVAVAIGFPAGVIWFLLRVEAFVGGRGDRFIAGNPIWILALPTAAGVYVTAMIAAAIQFDGVRPFSTLEALPNVLLVLIYSTIGYYLVRTQLANRRSLGGWSVSGLSLAIIFPTCAAMHAVYSLYAMTSQYMLDWHGKTVDWVGVPAGIYFLWVVQALYRGTFADWNGAPARRAAASPAVAAS